MSILTQKILYKSADEGTTYTINDQASMKARWTISPYFYIKVDSADGFYGADISSEAHPIPHAIGEVSGDTYRKGKGITLSGSIEGLSINHIEAGVRYLRQMFWDASQRKLMWNEYEGTQVYLYCRVLNDLSVTENFSQWIPKWTWTVGLRADDPRPRKESDDTLFYSWMT